MLTRVIATEAATTGSVNVYGNTTHGSATTHTYGGDTYTTEKPRSSLVITCSRERQGDAEECLDAEFTCISIRGKYGM